MKYYLFVDNFRGFSDTCIPITDANFLVGENSTGKSSILGLIKLFSGPGFFMGQDFAGEEAGFGHSLDMVSAHSEDQSYFRIGFASEAIERKDKKDVKVATGCLFTFREKQGQPRLYKCTFCREDEEITLKFGTAVYYKTSACVPAPSPQDIISILRSKWVGEHSGRDNGYEKLDVPRTFGGRIPIVIALSLASKGRGKRGEFTFYPPSMGFAPPELTWFGPIRTKPKRTYDELSLEFSPEGQHTPYLIRRMLNSKSQANRLKEFIEKVGKASGLFQDVRIKNFGRGVTSRFELDIVLDGKALNILSVGYGVSQSLPIIVELLAREPGTWFAIQEPEIHLHPRAQAALGDVLFEMATTDRKRFLVETHSDFTIDRFRMNYKSGRSRKPDGQILFFERRERHNVVTPLAIGKSGELPSDQPDTYRQFFVREQMNLLGI
ncbi:MAG TPA: AAA family ATPase [Candidatus Acidoferrales bacterium]|nr:AAA family ATPase [Candidatus Acidoferrales bacterium]